jgi:tRNA(fMet)-specific endonuclease VapC
LYILDINTLIYFFKGQGNIAKVLLTKAPSDIGLPTIFLYELEVGVAKSNFPEKRMNQLTALTSVENVLPFGNAEAKCAANIRAIFEQRGTPIGPYDILIAATAIVNNNTLITHNVKEFQRVQRLQIEDWY